MGELPAIFDALNSVEEEIRAASIELIESDAKLSQHMAMIDAMLGLLDDVGRSYEGRDEDGIAVTFLLMRLFNDLAAASKLILGGYYQVGLATARDAMELIFILHYFALDRASIARWRAGTEGQPGSEFTPANIRKVLDASEGSTEPTRKMHYKYLSAVAAHPSSWGNLMLRPGNGAVAKIGPFLDHRLLLAGFQELAVLSALAVEIVPALLRPSATLKDYRAFYTMQMRASDWLAAHGLRPEMSAEQIAETLRSIDAAIAAKVASVE